MAYNVNNADHDAEALYTAMKGLGTDEKTLTMIITGRSNAHLQSFEKKYNKNLEKEIKSETSGYYEDLLIALLEDHNTYIATVVNASIKGLGTNEQLLIDTVCTKTDEELKAIATAYQKKFGKDMAKEILDDLSGDMKNLFTSLFQYKRVEGVIDDALAKKDAKYLFEKGEKQWGTDEAAFIQIFTTRNRAQLGATSKAYADLTGHTLEVGIAKETSGDFKKSLTAFVTPLPEYWGDKVHNAIKGLGTDEATLIRVFVGNTKETLKAVNQYYTHKYSNSLLKDVSGDVSGDFGKALCAIIPSVA